MNDTTLPRNDPSGAEPSASPGQLRCQLNFAILLTGVVSLTLAGHLLLQYRALRREQANLEPIVTRFQTETQPLLQDLNNRLVEFGRTNPDIRPLLDKYGVATPTNPPVQRR